MAHKHREKIHNVTYNMVHGQQASKNMQIPPSILAATISLSLGTNGPNGPPPMMGGFHQPRSLRAPKRPSRPGGWWMLGCWWALVLQVPLGGDPLMYVEAVGTCSPNGMASHSQSRFLWYQLAYFWCIVASQLRHASPQSRRASEQAGPPNCDTPPPSQAALSCGHLMPPQPGTSGSHTPAPSWPTWHTTAPAPGPARTAPRVRPARAVPNPGGPSWHGMRPHRQVVLSLQLQPSVCSILQLLAAEVMPWFLATGRPGAFTGLGALALPCHGRLGRGSGKLTQVAWEHTVSVQRRVNTCTQQRNIARKSREVGHTRWVIYATIKTCEDQTRFRQDMGKHTHHNWEQKY